MASSGIQRNIIFALKLALGLGLLGIIVIRTDIEELVNQIQTIDVGYVFVAVFLQVLAKIIWTSRWQKVLRLNDIHRGFLALLGLVHIGLFFNNFLPSSVGGDAIRGYYTSVSKDALARSYGAVLIERILGVISLAFMSTSAVVYAILSGELQSSSLLLVLGGSGSIFLFAFGVSFFQWDGWRRLLDYIAELVPKAARIMRDLAASLQMFDRADRASSMIIIVNSIALQVVAVGFYLACARSLGLATPSVLFFIIIPISVVVSMIPVSLNGLGVREAALITMFVAQGADAAPVSAFVLLALVISTAFGLIGGVLYIFWRPVRPGNS